MFNRRTWLNNFKILLIYCFILSDMVLLIDNCPAQYTDLGLSTKVGFENNYNIYTWNYGLSYSTGNKLKYNLVLVEDFNSSLLKLNEGNKKWKDDQRFSLDFSYPFSTKYKGKINASSINFSDKFSDIKNDIKTNYGTFGLESQPFDVVNVASSIGYKFDQRYDQLDHGITYSFDLNTPFIDLSDYKNRIQFYLNSDNYAIRKNNDLNFQYQVNRNFYTDTSDSLAVGWSNKRRDNYVIKSDDIYIESFNEKIVKFDNKLSYRIHSVANLKLNSNIEFKRTNIDTIKDTDKTKVRSKVDITSLNTLSLGIKTSFLKEEIKLTNYSESQNTDSQYSSYIYGSSYPDFNSSRFSLLNNLNFYVLKNDTISTNFSISLFRYDTPKDTDYDDRDEQRINFNFSYVHPLNSQLKLKLNGGVNLKHLVFIFGQRSADNNWVRIFRLNPEIWYKYANKFNLFQSFEVLANYVDYDFEEKLPASDIRSFVFRKFTWQQTFNYNLTKSTNFNINYRLELEENGKLYWNDWTEVIISNRQNHYGKAYFEYKILSDAKISVGMVYYNRKEDLQLIHNNTFSNLNDYVSFGPSIKLIFEPDTKFNFSFSATRRAIDRYQQKRAYLNNLNINLIWYM